MYWKKKKLNYDILIPPLEKSFDLFSPDEAEIFFRWHQDNISARIAYLTNITGCILDYSFDSLISLWSWFLKSAQVETIPNEMKNEIREHLSNHHIKHIEYVISEESQQLSLQSQYMIRDISMYVGEIFTNFSSKIKWAYHTNVEQDSFANIPLLDGFEDNNFSPPFHMQFEPTHMLSVVAANLFDNTHSPKDLYNLCIKWCNFIPKY